MEFQVRWYEISKVLKIFSEKDVLIKMPRYVFFISSVFKIRTFHASKWKSLFFENGPIFCRLAITPFKNIYQLLGLRGFFLCKFHYHNFSKDTHSYVLLNRNSITICINWFHLTCLTRNLVNMIFFQNQK